MREDIPRYNITIHTGTDYQIDLSIIADDDTDLTNYGALIYDEILRDGTGSTISSEIMNCSEDWDISDEIMFLTNEGQIIVGSWIVEAQLREYPESHDHFDFDVSVTTDGYQLLLNHDITEKIPYTYGVYDVFITNADTGVKSKLLYGDAKIVRRSTR